jgi:chemotaxis protein MotB
MGEKRRKQPEEEGGADGFVVMMTSLSMIMLAFFIVMNALATINQIKVMKALDSLYGTFGPLSGGRTPEGGKMVATHEEFSEAKPKRKASYKSLLERQHLDPSIELLERDDSFTVVLSDDVLFTTGLNQISPRMFLSLNKIGSIVREIGQNVRIVGYSDATPAPPGEPTNLELSLMRAVLVQNYLMYGGRVSRALMEVEGRGEELSPHLKEQPDYLPKIDDVKRRRVEIVWGLDDL